MGLKMKKPRQLRNLSKCAICEHFCQYTYYGVHSCERCKQFFRRIVLRQGNFHCGKPSPCKIEKGESCRSCRLDRCLLMGMDATLVKAADFGQVEIRLFFEEMQRRKMTLLEGLKLGTNLREGENGEETEVALKKAQRRHKRLADKTRMESFLVQPLLCMENCLRRIWCSSRELPREYVLGHERLEDFLADERGNILAQASEFEMSANVLSKDYFRRQVELHGIYFPEHVNALVKDRFLCLEMAKSMHFFQQLNGQEQICLLRHILVPVTMFINCFYSFSALNANTWTRSNGFTFLGLYSSKEFEGDEKIQAWSQQLFSNTVGAFRMANMGREEFALLLGILLSSSNANGLSAKSRDLLYEESVHHSKALLGSLQAKYGQSEGAQKYAECMELLGMAFHFDYRLNLMTTYLKIFYSDQFSAFPLILPPIFKNSQLERQ